MCECVRCCVCVCACVRACVCVCVFACEFVRRGWFEVALGLWFEGTFRFVVDVVVVSCCTLWSD